MSGVYLVLGSNLGNRQANLTMALRTLPPLVRVDAVSPLYQSLPQPPAPPPPYLNAACRVTTGLDALPLLRYVKRIERMIGRLKDDLWAPRPIDIDIALYEREVIDLPDLAVPHARLPQRAFFLRPLLDLDPGLTDPRSGEPLTEMLRRVGEDGLQLRAEAGWFAA